MAFHFLSRPAFTRPDRDGNPGGKVASLYGKKSNYGSGRVDPLPGRGGVEIGVVEIDPTLARNKAINPYNDAFGSRRIEYYGELMKQRPR